jgi:hypothetical protein
MIRAWDLAFSAVFFIKYGKIWYDNGYSTYRLIDDRHHCIAWYIVGRHPLG